MLKITLDISKHEGTRLSRLDNYTEEDLDKELGDADKEDDNANEAIPRNDETGENRILVTKVNWLGRRERDLPKRKRPVAPGGTLKKAGELEDTTDDSKEEKSAENGGDSSKFVVERRNAPKENS